MKLPNIRRCISLLAVLSLIECGLIAFIGIWREWFWAAVQSRDLHNFIVYLSYFGLAALTICFISGFSQYLANYSALIVRRKLTKKALKLKDSVIDTVSQRIQEDCMSYPTLAINLLLGFGKQFVILLAYVGIVCHQLGWIYLLIPTCYALVGTFFAGWLAKPLIYLNYANQALEAKFRQTLLKTSYAKLSRNNINLITATKKLSYFQSFYNQITVIVPYILLFPVYFSNMIVFGVFMQCASSIAIIIECLSYFTNNFNDINKWLSCRKRLKELKVI